MSSREEVWSGDRSTSHLLGLNCHASSFPPSPFLFMYSLLLPFSSCSSQAFKAWSPWFGFQIVRGISAFFHWLSVLLMAAQFSSSLHCYGKRQFVFGCSFSFFFSLLIFPHYYIGRLHAAIWLSDVLVWKERRHKREFSSKMRFYNAYFCALLRTHCLSSRVLYEVFIFRLHCVSHRLK